MNTRRAHLGRLFTIARILARHGLLGDLAEALKKPPALGFAAPRPPFGFAQSLRLFQKFVPARDKAARRGERLAAALAELGPSFVKLGQVLSVRPDLVGADLAGDLGRLRDKLPPFPWIEARASIESELDGPLDKFFADMERQPVAAASIAQVHFAETTEGAPVAVKILRPGVEAAFARDLSLFAWMAAQAERHAPEMARLRLAEVVETMAQWAAIELDLRLEAAAAAELAENFKDDPDLGIPAVDWQRTARRVLTLQRISGIPIEDRAALIAAGIDVKALAVRVIQVFLRQALRDGYFHADMHHGNLFVAAESGKLELVDFGIMGRLDLPTRRFMAEMLGAFLSGQWRRAAEVHFEAGYVPANQSVDAFAQACRSIGEPILGKPVTEISIGRLLAQLFQITETFGMRTQPHLLLLQKTMVTVEGVARSLDPEIDFWAAARPIVMDWAEENMGPRARIETALRHGLEMANRLPQLIAALEKLAQEAEAERAADMPAAREKLGWRERGLPGLTNMLLGAIALLLLALLLR